jgi:gliding motility-associated-like protein
MKASVDNRFDELFKERFQDFSENPPVSVLEKLKVTTSGISNPIPFWKKGGFFATLGVVLISGITILLINSFSTENTSQKNNLIAENNSVQKASVINNDLIESNSITTDNKTKDIPEILTENSNNSDKTNNTEKITDNITPIKEDGNKEIIQTNKTIPANNTNDVNIVIHLTVKSATCRRSNGKAYLSSNFEKTEFYWTDIDKEKPHSFRENLSAGNYNIKSVTKDGYVKKFILNIPDSAILRAGFTHYSMTDAIGVPVYFTNETTIDGVAATDIENTTFKWYFGDGSTSFEAEPEHMYNSTGPFTISLVATSPLGCRDSVTMAPLNISGSGIDVSNIFTPNGDGKNDVFIPVAQALRTFNCVIMSRNGQQLYEWNDPTKGWDGKINKGNDLASPGTYYYILKGIGIDGKIINHTGTLTLSMDSNY